MKLSIVPFLALCLLSFPSFGTVFGSNPDDGIYLFEPSGKVAGHEYVDLGLSVDWAFCNVGSDSAQAEGDLFAWGETVANEEYDWNTYKYSKNATSVVTKYCSNPKQGRVDKVSVLEPDDDAATVAWGEEWRTPTAKEYQELIDNCNWQWVYADSAQAVMGISKKNGAMILFPAIEFVDDDEKTYFRGWYWSASLAVGNDTQARQFFFKLSSAKTVAASLVKTPRCYGRQVRAVTPKVEEEE